MGGPRRLRRGLRYLIAGLPLGVAAFAVAVAGLTLGVATAVVWVGLPVLAATLRACRTLAAVECRATERATGRVLPPRRAAAASGLLRRLADPEGWRSLLHAVVGFPVRLAAGVLAVAWAAAGLAGTLAVGWRWAVPRDPDRLTRLVAEVGSRPQAVALVTVTGVVLLAALPLVVRGLVALRAGLARSLLTGVGAGARPETTATEPRTAVAPVAVPGAEIPSTDVPPSTVPSADASSADVPSPDAPSADVSPAAAPVGIPAPPGVERERHDPQRLVRLDGYLLAALRCLDDTSAQA